MEKDFERLESINKGKVYKAGENIYFINKMFNCTVYYKNIN